MYLSKEEFWAASAQLPAEEVELVDPHGRSVGKIRMRGLTGAELEEYQQSLQVAGGRGGRPGVSYRNAMTRLVAMCAINEDGSPFFDKSEQVRLAQAPSWLLMQLFESAIRLSGMTEQDVKDLAGNFDETQGEPSSSG
ncbi:MAG: hypothetical protein IRZ07_04170 [Microbispora sp.]|nr:hypothetical protein [Microbispora sp.]